jgi:hypothetical protein
MKMFGWMASACIAVALLGGCSKGDSGANVPGGKEDPAAKALMALADKPDVYMQTLYNSIVSGDSKAIWNALPAKYQADVVGLKNDFAAKMDADVWNKTFVVVGKTAQVFKTKKEMLLANPLLEIVPPPVVDSLKNSWDSVVGMVDTVAQSEIKTLDGLKSADPATFLASTGNMLLGSGLKVAATFPPAAERVAKMKQVKVSLVKVDGDTATLKVETEGEPAMNDVVKRVDGKWLPAEIVDGWDKNIADAKANLADLKIPPELKPSLMEGLTAVEGRIDALLIAKDQETFNKELNNLTGVVQAFMSAPVPAATATGTGAPAVAPGTAPLGGPSLGSGPGSLPPPGSLPKPSGTITPPTLPGSGVGAPPSSGPALGTPEPKLPLPK